MKILILSDDFPSLSFGGAGIAAYRLAKVLQNLGQEILVFSTTRDSLVAGQTVYDQLPVLFVESNYNPRWHGWVGLYNPKVLAELKKVLIDFQPDIVHAHNVHGYISYAALRLAKRHCRKVFLTAHDTDIFYRGKFHEFIDKKNLNVPARFDYQLSWPVKLRQWKIILNPVRRWLIGRYLQSVDKIFAVSQQLRQALARNGVGNVAVVYNGLILGQETADGRKFRERFNLLGDQKVILMAGRFNTLKGGRLIIDYIKEIKNQLTDFVFVFAGQANGLTKEVQQQLQNFNLERHFLLTGWLEPAEMAGAYQASDLVITPSVYLDVFNLTNIEAMAAGKPVVGTCFGGTPEIVVDGVTGYIVNPYDLKKTAGRIVELLTDKEKSRALGQAGRERVLNHFSLNNQAAALLDYYRAP